MIYVVDEQGKIEREFTPVLDGTLKGPDAVFRLIEFYLSVVEHHFSGPREKISRPRRCQCEVAQRDSGCQKVRWWAGPALAERQDGFR